MIRQKAKPIHVMHILGNFGMGGAEMGVLRLIQGSDTEKLSHSIAILGQDRSLLDETGADVSCHALNIVGRSYLAFWRLIKFFKQQKVDLVHVNNIAPWFDCTLAARLAGCRCIETFHGVEQGALTFSNLRRRFIQVAESLTDHVTAVAEPAAELLVELTGLNRNRVEVIVNGVDTDQFMPLIAPKEKILLRRAKGLPEKTLLFGCVAALRPVKNHRGLLQAFSKALREGGLRAELVLVGDGSLTEDLQVYSRKLGIADNVRFLGRRADVQDLLKCLDVFVLNSVTEGLSYAVLEAMATGLPVVATAVGANKDLIITGCSGFLVESEDNDALADILVKIGGITDVLPTMGTCARKTVVESFSLQNMILSYQKLYERIMWKV